MAIVYGLLNIVVVNTYVLLKMAIGRATKRRYFLKKLAIDLITPQLGERFTWPSSPMNLKFLLGGI